MPHSQHLLGYHDLDDLTVAYVYEGYDIDTDITTIYANAAKTCTGMVPTEHFHQMSLEWCKLWASISDDDRSIILDQDSIPTLTLTDSFDHSQGRESAHGHGESGRRCGSFAHQHDKQCVLFHDQEPNNMASKRVTETTASTNTHISMDFNLLDTVCEQFNVDINTLYAQVAQHHTARSKQGEA